MLDRSLEELDEFKPEFAPGGNPYFQHLRALGYSTLWHLAAILGTPAVIARLDKGRCLSRLKLIPVVEACLTKYCNAGNIELRREDGPELPHVFFTHRRPSVSGWIPDRSEAPGAEAGRPVPARRTAADFPDCPKPPAADDLTTALPPRVVLNVGFAVSNQGSRGTCVAHTVAALYYGACLKAGQTARVLSVQYLYAWAKQNLLGMTINGNYIDLRATDGTTFEAALNVLATRGACLDSDLAYIGEHDLSQFHCIRPFLCALDEAGLEQQAKGYRIKSYRAVAVTAEAVKRELFNRRPVGVGLPLYRVAWANPVTDATGEVAMPLTMPRRKKNNVEQLLADQPVGGHAVAVIGYQDGGRFAGGGAFLFRNSWGGDWASEHASRRGLGWLPYEYLDRYAQAAYVIDELR